MTIASTMSSVQTPCNGVTTQFSFNNKIFAAADLVVTLIDTIGNLYAFLPSGFNTFTNAATGLSYTVFNVDVDAGCFIVFTAPPTNAWKIDLRTLIAELQSTSIKNQGSFLPELHEEFFDKATRMLQDLFRLTYTFGIHGPDNESSPWSALPSAALRASQLLGFNSGGGLALVSAIPTTGQAYARTALEIAASVIPTNVNYLPGDLRRYGADPTGALDATGAITAALSCNTDVFVPSGTFKFTSFVMPTTFGLTLRGTGNGSILKQTGTGITWPVNLAISYPEQVIKDLNFNCTNGTGHTIDTTYTGGQTLSDLYFTDVPAGFDCLHLDGSSTTYTHDNRLRGIQMYFGSGNGGHAGIGLGAHFSDSSIEGWIMNCSNGVQGASYCLWIADGAQSTSISNSHPYGALVSVIASAATGVIIAQGFTFTNVTIDFSYGSDNVSLTNYSCPVFTGCWIQAIQSGRSGIVLTNCRAASIVNLRWDGAAGALYIVKEVGTTDYTMIIGGDSPSIGNFNNPAVLFVGAHSVIKNFVAINPFGVQQIFNGSTVSAIPANTTTFLGANGAQAAINSTAFMVPLPGGMNVANAVVAFDAAPGAGQTYTISLIGNGVTLTAAAGSANPLVVTGTGTFGGTISIAPGGAQFLNQFNQVYLKFVSSATAGTPSVRYAITATG